MALGLALKSSGHSVTICTSAVFKSFITEHGLNYQYMNDDFIRLMNSDAGRQAIEDTNNLIGAAKTTLKLFKRIKPILKQTLMDSWAAAQAVDPDIIILGSKGTLAEPVAEKLGVPVVMAMPIPQLVPTTEIPSIGFPPLDIGGWYNLLTYRVVGLSMRLYGRMLNGFRQDILGLDKKSGQKMGLPVQLTSSKT
jgi:sterol 3beta-glucosyltransferase